MPTSERTFKTKLKELIKKYRPGFQITYNDDNSIAILPPDIKSNEALIQNAENEALAIVAMRSFLKPTKHLLH